MSPEMMNNALLVLSILMTIAAFFCGVKALGSEAKGGTFGFWYASCMSLGIFAALLLASAQPGILTIVRYLPERAMQAVYEVCGGRATPSVVEELEPPVEVTDPTKYVEWDGDFIRRTREELVPGWRPAVVDPKDPKKARIIGVGRPVEVKDADTVMLFMDPSASLKKEGFVRTADVAFPKPSKKTK